RFYRNAEEMFAVTSWVQVMLGQRIQPRNYHPAVDLIPDSELDELVGGVQRVIAACVNVMPAHEQFIARYCAADKM
ncbi:MAG TPA: tryptophan 7-halogenase, partial [Rudaea sp.]|nr:tryptophan 7-halogenase [Rudaea sp.]